VSLKREIDKVAAQLREACIEKGITHTPDLPTCPWKDLDERRKDRWRVVAATYIHVFRSLL